MTEQFEFVPEMNGYRYRWPQRLRDLLATSDSTSGVQVESHSETAVPELAYKGEWYYKQLQCGHHKHMEAILYECGPLTGRSWNVFSSSVEVKVMKVRLGLTKANNLCNSWLLISQNPHVVIYASKISFRWKLAETRLNWRHAGPPLSFPTRGVPLFACARRAVEPEPSPGRFLSAAPDWTEGTQADFLLPLFSKLLWSLAWLVLSAGQTRRFTVRTQAELRLCWGRQEEDVFHWYKVKNSSLFFLTAFINKRW